MKRRRRAQKLSRRRALGAAVSSVGGLLGCARTALDLDTNGSVPAGSGGSGGSGSAGLPSHAGAGATSGAGMDGKGGAPPLPPFEPESVPEDRGTFDLGVQAGEMSEESVLFWTHMAHDGPVELCIWADGEPRHSPPLRSAIVRPSAAGFVHERISGLLPLTRYRYVFFSQSRKFRSAIGRVRTAPSGDLDPPLLIGALACTNFAYLPYRTAELIATEPLDYFVHTGDMSYNDGAQTLEDFRAKWRSTLDSSGYRALLASTGAYFTWDDHEVTNNFDAEALERSELLAAARETYFESLAKRPNAIGGLWQSFRWGRTAELFVLDCRGERRPSTLGSKRPIYVSDAQLDWLKEGLSASKSHFKIVVTSVPIGRLSSELYAAPSDRWEGYVAQREELLAFIDERGIDNVWFLSGDLHMGLVHRVDLGGRDARLWEVCAGPGGQSTHDAGLFQPGAEALHERAFPTEQVAYASPELAYTTFEFDPATDSVRVRFVHPEGRVSFDRVLR